MPTDQPATITFKGNPVTLVGNALAAGDLAPNFTLQANDLSEVSLDSAVGKTRVIATVPSLDTSVCAMETKNFNEKIAGMENVEFYCISMDLPFAQKRWCGAENVTNLKTLSAHQSTDFGTDYGVLIQGGPLNRILARAIFVVGPGDILSYVEYVPEIAQEPNYQAVLDAIKS